jgi:hypothetical protein
VPSRHREDRADVVTERGKFARIPERVSQARERGDLSYDEHAVLVMLVEDMDYRNGEVVGTLRTLADRWGWKKTHQHLRNVLHALRDRDEIAFEVQERQKTPWVIYVVGDGFGVDCKASAKRKSTADLQSVQTPHAPQRRGDSVEDGDSDVIQLQRAASTDVDVDADRDTIAASAEQSDYLAVVDLLEALVLPYVAGVDNDTLQTWSHIALNADTPINPGLAYYLHARIVGSDSKLRPLEETTAQYITGILQAWARRQGSMPMGFYEPRHQATDRAVLRVRREADEPDV